jgi:translation initiation factor IF-2
LIRVAAAAISGRGSLPSDEKPAGLCMRLRLEAPAGTGDAIVEASARSRLRRGSVDARSRPGQARSAKPVGEVESDAAKARIDAAVSSATGLSGERLAMARGAVEAVGGRIADVRLVRVVAVEEEVAGSTTVGGYRYLVDLLPSSMKQVAGAKEDEHGRRGGGRGGARGGGSGKRGAPAGATGGFSMDSLRDDRKGGRGGGRGRPGGEKRPGGGGTAGGGAAGSPRGGTP